jgi:release factor glutamine methyltransferase
VTSRNPSASRLLERGASELERVGVADSRFQAELLLRHALGCSREALLARLHEPVPAEASGHFFQLVERRRGRVPVQYVVGTQEFYGLSFRVTPAVLIPRPESEGIVEEALAELGGTDEPTIVDVGCGSGCLAVAIAHALPGARLTATDASPAALAIARENSLRHGVADRIEFLEGDLLDPLTLRDVDAIVSNPPYIADVDLENLEPEVSEHEPRQALSGGADGLSVIERLLPAAHRALCNGGLLFMEIGHDQDRRVRTLLESSGLTHLRTTRDLAGIPRVIVARNG